MGQAFLTHISCYFDVGVAFQWVLFLKRSLKHCKITSVKTGRAQWLKWSFHRSVDFPHNWSRRICQTSIPGHGWSTTNHLANESVIIFNNRFIFEMACFIYKCPNPQRRTFSHFLFQSRLICVLHLNCNICFSFGGKTMTNIFACFLTCNRPNK